DAAGRLARVAGGISRQPRLPARRQTRRAGLCRCAAAAAARAPGKILKDATRMKIWWLWLALLPLPAQAQWLNDTRAIMGTAVSVELWADDDAAGRAAIDAVMAEMHRIEAAMSPFIDS